MLLPINLFDNLTCYTKANWQCGLAPEAERTWSKWQGLDGFNNIKQTTVGNYTRFEWTDSAAESDWLAVALYANEQLYSGWAFVLKMTFRSAAAMKNWNPWTGALKMSYSLNGKPTDLTVVSQYVDDANLCAYYIIPAENLKKLKDAKGNQSFSWFAFGETKIISRVYFDKVEVQMVPVDWLAAGKKAPISAGDKLGLVYWDGTTFSADSTYAVFVKNNPDWDCVYLYKGWGGLGVRKISTDTNKILIPNGSTGTVNLSGYGFTITGIANGKGTNPLGKHLMHVI